MNPKDIFWKIEELKKQLEEEKKDEIKTRVTRKYEEDLRIKIKLMEEAFRAGQESIENMSHKAIKSNWEEDCANLIKGYGKMWDIKPHVLAGRLWWKDAMELAYKKGQESVSSLSHKAIWEEGFKEGICKSTYPLAFEEGFKKGKQEREIEILEIIDKWFHKFENTVVKVEKESDTPFCLASPDFENPANEELIFSAQKEYFDLKKELKKEITGEKA